MIANLLRAATLVSTLALLSCGSTPAAGDGGRGGRASDQGGAGELPDLGTGEVTGPALELAYAMPVGETVRYRIVEDSKVRIETRTDIDAGERLQFDLSLVAGDGGTITATFDRVAYATVKSELGGGSSWDSAEGKPKLPLEKSYAALIGKSFRFALSANGEVSKVRGGRQLTTAFVAKLGVQGIFLKKRYEAEFSNQGLQTRLQRWFGVLPPAAVAQGETWPVRGNASYVMVGELVNSGEAAIVGRSGNTTDIAANCTLESVGGSAVDPSAMSLQSFGAADIQSAQEGWKIRFDHADGQLISRSSEAFLEAVLTAKNPGPDGKRTTARETLRATTSVERL